MAPDALADFVAELKREFPRFRIIRKSESPVSVAIDLALKIVTFGGQSSYLTHYHTVLGDRLYVPLGWEHCDCIDAIITLRHERVHLRQRRRYTLLGMAILYLCLPLPVGFAFYRAKMEMEAYFETLRATYQLKGKQALMDRELRERIICQFTSPAYGWMWPFRKSVERWYDRSLQEILNEDTTRHEK